MRLFGALVLALLVGCTPAPRELTPKEVLDRAADALDKATTAHFALEQQNGTLQLAQGVQVANAEGDVLRPDRVRMKFTLRLAGFSAEAQMIAVGEELFITNPLSGQWQKAPARTGAPRVLDQEHGMSSLLRNVTDPQRVGNETLDGAQTQHLKGRVAATSFAEMTGSQPTGDLVAGDVWVGSDDFLPRQVRLEGPIGAGDTAQTIRTLKLSKFNEPVTIERPS
jgi:LppX_LprAFG lipoprotein